MAMWINWYPVFETGVNYAYTYKNTLNKPMVRVESEKLKNIFKCKEVIGEITLQVITNQTYYIKYDNNFLKTDYPQRLYLILIYDKTQCKTIKFKRGNLYIKINTEKGECESDDYTTISDELELINDVTSYGYANTDIGIKLPMSQFTLTEEFGIEYNLDPYVWTTEQGKSWTPSQLKFPSMVKYSNILNENNSDSGDAVPLPEISSADGAEHYLQDDSGYCYIKDNEENIVYNKFLNQLARKTKINNGYRINGDQSLELISFNNNIKDYDKQSGQYLFSENKTQKYGNKENNNQTDQKQNVPYFGGNPAIYPVIVYSNMLSNSEDVTVIKNDTNVIINNKSFAYDKEKDIIIYYVRNAYQSEDVVYKTKVKDYSKKEEWRFKFLGSDPFKSGDISCQLTDQATNISFSAEKTPVIWSAELTNNLGILSDTILNNPNNLTTSQKEYFDKIIEYIDIDFYVGSSLEYQEDWFYFNHNMNLSIGVFYGGGLNPAAFYFTGNAIKIPYIGTSSATYYVSSNSSVTCSPDYNKTYRTFRIPISINYNHLPGLFPKTIGFFAESSDKGEKNISLNGETGKRTWEIQASPVRTSFKQSYTTYEDTQFLFDYADVYYNVNNVPESVGGPDILGYIEFNNNSAQQAIAIVIWKNGKLLENS